MKKIGCGTCRSLLLSYIFFYYSSIIYLKRDALYFRFFWEFSTKRWTLIDWPIAISMVCCNTFLSSVYSVFVYKISTNSWEEVYYYQILQTLYYISVRYDPPYVFRMLIKTILWTTLKWRLNKFDLVVKNYIMEVKCWRKYICCQ